eukprot:TRINITY_DN4748_c0_g1_i7.p1 TRINITY_DN4748_c0_g1~~TRINITY_DN4748_c0_g1_i7.p1  ORF type:complete len:250 (-),score=19.49 TRINITY_DN4748_c0_g1_i7:47-796(-)
MMKMAPLPWYTAILLHPAEDELSQQQDQVQAKRKEKEDGEGEEEPEKQAEEKPKCFAFCCSSFGLLTLLSFLDLCPLSCLDCVTAQGGIEYPLCRWMKPACGINAYLAAVAAQAVLCMWQSYQWQEWKSIEGGMGGYRGCRRLSRGCKCVVRLWVFFTGLAPKRKAVHLEGCMLAAADQIHLVLGVRCRTKTTVVAEGGRHSPLCEEPLGSRCAGDYSLAAMGGMWRGLYLCRQHARNATSMDCTTGMF